MLKNFTDIHKAYNCLYGSIFYLTPKSPIFKFSNITIQIFGIFFSTLSGSCPLSTSGLGISGNRRRKSISAKLYQGSFPIWWDSSVTRNISVETSSPTPTLLSTTLWILSGTYHRILAEDFNISMLLNGCRLVEPNVIKKYSILVQWISRIESLPGVKVSPS